MSSQGVSCAGMHRPVYTDSIYGNTLSGDVGFTQDLRAALERLFFQYEVRLLRMCYPACLSGAMLFHDSILWPAVPLERCRSHRAEGALNAKQTIACVRTFVVWCVQVDATWYGHVHQYSRTCPVFQVCCTP